MNQAFGNVAGIVICVFGLTSTQSIGSEVTSNRGGWSNESRVPDLLKAIAAADQGPGHGVRQLHDEISEEIYILVRRGIEGGADVSALWPEITKTAETYSSDKMLRYCAANISARPKVHIVALDPNDAMPCAKILLAAQARSIKPIFSYLRETPTAGITDEAVKLFAIVLRENFASELNNDAERIEVLLNALGRESQRITGSQEGQGVNFARVLAQLKGQYVRR